MRIIANRFAIDDAQKPRIGGMAEVYKASDVTNLGHVAIKLFDPGMCKSERLTLEAFSRETRSLNALNEHPHIAKIIDCGTDDASQGKYIALEWLELDLELQLKENPAKGWDDFYEKYGRPILDALRFAFGRGIMHRDIKPKNILLNDDKVVKVADFGIAKFKEYYRPGVTLGHFASRPYAPPEADSGSFGGTRDVYSFAVMCMESLSDEPFDEGIDLARAIEAFDAPAEIVALIARAVDIDPEMRPSSVIELFDEMESIQNRRDRKRIEKIPCYIRVAPKVSDQLAFELKLSSSQKVQEWVLGDLNDEMAIDRWQFTADGVLQDAPDQFSFLTTDYRYQVAIDNKSDDRLVIIKAIKSLPARLESQRERAWVPPFQYRAGNPVDNDASRRVIASIGIGLDEHLAERNRLDALRRENDLFDAWAAILRYQDQLQQRLQNPVRFRDSWVNGGRVTLVVDGVPDPSIIGEERIIRTDDRRIISGVVEEVSEAAVTCYVGEISATDVPKFGELVVDTRGQRVPINRQQAALDAVRFDRASRSDLRRILVDPSICRPPDTKPAFEFFQTDLDEYKVQAARGALNAKDFYVVEGPPGTGKTKLIAEIMLQHLAANPGSRILLTSQTHNALDNAIERVQKLINNSNDRIRIVRIATRNDPRVAEEVKGLLLETQVEKWLSKLSKESEIFLQKTADAYGIRKSDVELGMAAAKLRGAIMLEQKSNAEHSQIQQILENLEIEKDHGTADAEPIKTDMQLSIEISARSDELSSAYERARKSARKVKEARKALEQLGDDGRSLSVCGCPELEEWEALLVHGSEKTKKFKQLVDLYDDWVERFGRAEDFFGAFLADAQIVAGTCIGFMKKGLQDLEFDLCIVDEASKATPPETLVPIVRAKKWVIVGDPQQLPPFVAQGQDEMFGIQGIEFERLDFRNTLLNHLISRVPKECHTVLKKQYRMIKPIGDLISACFYQNTLESEPTYNFEYDAFHAIPKPVTWFTTSKLSLRNEQKVGKSFKNFAEVDVVKRLLGRLKLAADSIGKDVSVAILTGYLPQVEEMERMVANVRRDLGRLTVDCNTVDAYQGREIDIVIYSIVRSNNMRRLGFLKERERLNVALSRCRSALAIVGDSLFCQGVDGENPFADVLMHIKAHPADCCLKEAEA